ncbi:hypothetical protein AVEN_217395-1 [Araneus ventricosus]|uniref:RNA-directed DNA polymerase from mobile element jockey n=1 Tax=Araneus ventricosus TaxID=182803 RepID=A0A4Y2I0N4_ARAVE|nr:hypothetical protein AVEN_217395-1 [Araneus ventricosus]
MSSRLFHQTLELTFQPSCTEGLFHGVIKPNIWGSPWTERLKFGHHIDEIRNKFRLAKTQLYPLIGKGSKLSLRSKRQIYKSRLRPLISYASPVWCVATRTHLKKLETLRNKSLRPITILPWFFRNHNIRKDLNLPSLGKSPPDYIEKWTPVLGD